jgi:SAM-dependent methyltransferase
MKTDKRQLAAELHYSKLMLGPEIDLASSVGRRREDIGLTRYIWKDIATKLGFRRNCTFLDIGCGFGDLTTRSIKESIQMNLKLTLLDIPAVIERIKSGVGNYSLKNIQFKEGVFPEILKKQGFKDTFDFISAYSVIHYTDFPEDFLDSAVSLLNHRGRLLIGDLPNVNKKGRFLSSDYGYEFESRYKKESGVEIVRYKSQREFCEQTKKQEKQNFLISDSFINRAIQKYRSRGYDVYVLPQNKRAPFSHTREDLLIVRP